MGQKRTVRRWGAGVILACAGQAWAQPQVRLSFAQFDPLRGLPDVGDLGVLDPAEPGVYLVQCEGAPTEAWRRRIEAAGGTIGPFLTDHTHIVRMDAIAAGRVSKVAGVRWVGPYRAAYKLSEEVRGELAGADGEARYSIQLVERGPAMQNRAAAAVVRGGGLVDARVAQGSRLEATLNHAALRALAAMPEVLWIERIGPPGRDMTLARTVSGVTPYLTGLGFSGQGVRGEITDDGLLDTHIAFQTTPVLYYGPVPPIEFHGTGCYGICFSDGTGNVNATGMLPAGQGIFLGYAQLTDFGGSVTRYTSVADLVNPSLAWQGIFQLSAWGGTRTTQYNSVSAEIDDIVFLHDIIIAQSQSNVASQMSRPQAWGKNVVAVGGVDLRGTVNMLDDQAGEASFGPAADGRVKPEFTHSEADATVPCSFNNSCFGGFGGTSASASMVAGAFGLVMQMWHQGVWTGFGGGSSVFASRPHSATARALVISSTHQYDWTVGGPNATLGRDKQGWGLPNLQTLHQVASRTFIINQTDPLVPLQTRTYPVTVAAAEPSLRIVMVYTDPPGIPAAAQARINDLTLRVTGPGGSPVYWGNAGLYSGIWSTTGGAADTINTVECVFIQNPAPGDWTIEVIGSEIVQDANVGTPGLDAHFALVAAGAVAADPPAICYPNCDGSTNLPLLTPNDFGCFLNAYAAGSSQANCDGSTNLPLLTPNDFGCFMNSYAAGCS